MADDKNLTLNDISPKEKEDQARTKRNKEAFLQAWQKSRGIIAVCCDAVGISRETFYQYRANDPDFARSLQAVRAKLNEEIEDILIGKALIEKDGASVRFYLEKKHPDYKNRVKFEGSMITSTKPLEELLREAAIERLKEKHGIPNGASDTGGDRPDGQQGADRGVAADTEQARGDGEVQSESGASEVLETKDAA